ncbi:MAG: ComEC/Rec2 family competence protein [Arthrobacter sp.]
MDHGSRWQRYVDAAARRPAANQQPREAKGPPPPEWSGRLRMLGPRLRTWCASWEAPGGPAPAREDLWRRTDVRLVPMAAMVWVTAAAAQQLPPAVLAALCMSFVTGSGLLLAVAAAGSGSGQPGPPARRSFRATMAVALLLAAAAGGHAAADSSLRHEGAVSAAAAEVTAVAAEVEVTGTPRRLKSPGHTGAADRWAVPVTLIDMTFDAQRVRVPARLLVLGGAGWEYAVPGRRIRTTGKLAPPTPGLTEAAVLLASSVPTTVGEPGTWQLAPGELRSRFTAATGQFGGDARGLLPGMVTGDTTLLDEELDVAMRSVGMTHLTAVSGANCSVILGALLLAARSLRLSRVLASVLCLVGLGLFVLVVGPDASVLRAAVMGAIGLAALAGGRPGRGLSLLCVAVTGLVLLQPVLAASFGFLLSVLATLGIVTTGRPVMKWFPAAVPRWAAAAVAVPLSAQAFCGPVIVLLQPQFTSYALPANMAAAALVAPVTLLGTAAVPLVPLAPGFAAVPLGVAAAFAAGVGGIARFFAGLPGAVLPWPDGAYGAATMALFSAAAFAAWWLAFHPFRTAGLALTAHQRTVALLNRIPMRGDGRHSAREGSWPGLVHRPGRGRLRVCTQSSGRKPQWLLPRPHAPGPRLRTRPPGAM